MKTISIQSALKEYHVVMLDNLNFLHELSKRDNSEFVIDNRVYGLYQRYFDQIPQKKLFLVNATEENKVIDTALSICEKLTEIPAKRNEVYGLNV